MARLSNFLPAIDESPTLSTTHLNKRGLLDAGFYVGVLNWEAISVNYTVKPNGINKKRITLNYNYYDETVKYSIRLVAIPTNLGNGKRWYFICPSTCQRCLKLIKPMGSKYFFHRSAFPKLIYGRQKWSKAARRVMPLLGTFEINRLESELNAKYRKRHYRGKPTPLNLKIEKKYEKLAKAVEANES